MYRLINIGLYIALDVEQQIDEDMIVYYLYTDKVTSSLTISSKTATCKSTVIGTSGKTSKITITQYLQKKSGDTWKNITSWSKTVNSFTTSFSNSKASLSSGTYRTRTVAKVYKGANYETIKVSSSTKTC